MKKSLSFLCVTVVLFFTVIPFSFNNQVQSCIEEVPPVIVVIPPIVIKPLLEGCN